MNYEQIEKKFQEIMELLKPQAVQPPEEWEDVTARCGAYPWNAPGQDEFMTFYLSDDGTPVDNTYYRLRKIHGMHNGPAFVVERKKA